ncbi:hypothetical protein [Metapseudomonas resinovorans]|uniref:Uncharacterized protein n=1 Tax=Metapseudomonas resinovorans NBRC 106553 TaxID=1245471 RepID=S6AJJ5_METRE|nr:hypothetical protein [Pseudomonas resinovorans]BAN48675.1 hypothetical protein PCA10_29430 [Pseudomonas resinovorans NBRC 106553]
MAYRRQIFITAALFNWVIGGALIVAMPLVEGLLGLAPVTASDKVFVDLFAVLVIAFGVGYWKAAMDFQQYRLFALWGAWAKLGVVAVVCWHFINGHIGWPLLALSGGDLFYAWVFLALLRNAGQPSAQGTLQ